MRGIVFLATFWALALPASAGELDFAKAQLSRELSECAAYYYTLAMPKDVGAEGRHRLMLAGRRAKALCASISGERQALASMESAMDAMLVSMRFDWSNIGILREHFEHSCDYLVQNPGRRLLTWVDRYVEARQAEAVKGAGQAAGMLGNVSSAVAATVPLPAE